MKRNKYGYLGLILACIAVVQYNYHLNEYVLLLLVVVSIALLWEFLEYRAAGGNQIDCQGCAFEE